MSRRRKHVRDLVDEPCPELAACEAVCRVVELRGGNHIEVRRERGRGSDAGAWSGDDVNLAHRRRRPRVSSFSSIAMPVGALADLSLSRLERTDLSLRPLPTRAKVEKPDSSRTLCRIPSKFSKILWVRAGSFIVARFEEEALDESSHDAKVTGEMTRALYHTQMKEMRRANRWPALFAETETKDAERVTEKQDDDADDDDASDDSDDSLPPIEVIRNRPRRAKEESSSSDEDGGEED